MITKLENPFYYLDNFQQALAWISERYDDLLNREERNFIASFCDLPLPSRALLVRMAMRKGPDFRASKLRYEEIGDTQIAAQPLATLGWIDDHSPLTLEQMFALLTRTEIVDAFRDVLPASVTRKSELFEALRTRFPEARPFDAWYPRAGDAVYQLRIAPLWERLRLLFFGNLHQDWSEFVLSELGIYRYEKVEFSASSRGFRTRDDVDTFLHLQACQERLALDEPVETILAAIPAHVLDNEWLEGRRAKLLYQLALHCERNGDLVRALDIYTRCRGADARIRAIRVHERLGQFSAASALAQTIARAAESEAEMQQLARILPRLHRKLGMDAIPSPVTPPVPRIDLRVQQPAIGQRVEMLVAHNLARPDAPVYYVENALILSLFGLLCWQPIFAPVPGAFFHPFHIGPADLHSVDFRRRRARQFNECLAHLDSGEYIETIRRNFADKAGIQSAFVNWPVLTETLMDLALACIPAGHLKNWFERILQDIGSNRSGLPDLIQFWPLEKRYRMIEVKAPGDRLQDNQIRWLDHCSAHDMPVAVCYVQWADECMSSTEQGTK